MRQPDPDTRRTPGGRTGGSRNQQLGWLTDTASIPPTGSEMRHCVTCHDLTLRTDVDGLPRHANCEPQHTYSTAPVTSWAAGARTGRGPRSRLAGEIHRLILLAGERGLTDDELVGYLPAEHAGSVSKRRGDLSKAGIVADSGRTRQTRRNRDAIVWVLAGRVTK